MFYLLLTLIKNLTVRLAVSKNLTVRLAFSNFDYYQNSSKIYFRKILRKFVINEKDEPWDSNSKKMKFSFHRRYSFLIIFIVISKIKVKHNYPKLAL